MEPFSALSVVTAIVQFLDFTGKVVAGAYKIHTAESSTENALREVTKSLNRASKDLRNYLSKQPAQGLTPNDLGKRLLSIPNNIHKTAKSPKLLKVFASFKAAWIAAWKKSDIEALCRDLDGCRSQIILLLLVSLRYEMTHYLRSCSH